MPVSRGVPPLGNRILNGRSPPMPTFKLRYYLATVWSAPGDRCQRRATRRTRSRDRRSGLLASCAGIGASPPGDSTSRMFPGPGGDIGRRLHHALHQRSLRNKLQPPFFALVRRVERAYRQYQLDHRRPVFKRGSYPRCSRMWHAPAATTTRRPRHERAFKPYCRKRMKNSAPAGAFLAFAAWQTPGIFARFQSTRAMRKQAKDLK